MRRRARDPSDAKASSVFLSAEWRDLVMLNYEVDPSLLKKRVPRNTTLDAFRGKTYVSLVGFRFSRTKLLGYLRVPFHTDFDEVNLRFYVHREARGEDRRGVVFIAEIVPKWAVAQMARLFYGENYTHYPMRHFIRPEGLTKTAEYQWQMNGSWCKLHAETSAAPVQPMDGSLEQFITEHYWGYSARKNGDCIEYHVSHPAWRVWASTTAGFEGDTSALYGSELAGILHKCPDSAFIAEGSPVVVFSGERIS
jgi:uncharacterized protein YqjF (DUF2071 family)